MALRYMSVPCAGSRLDEHEIHCLMTPLSGLRGVLLNRDTSERARHLGEQTEVGMLAQEAEEVLPEIVSMDAEGYRSLDYPKLTAFLIEVAKAQQR